MTTRDDAPLAVRPPHRRCLDVCIVDDAEVGGTHCRRSDHVAPLPGQRLSSAINGAFLVVIPYQVISRHLLACASMIQMADDFKYYEFRHLSGRRYLHYSGLSC